MSKYTSIQHCLPFGLLFVFLLRSLAPDRPVSFQIALCYCPYSLKTSVCPSGRLSLCLPVFLKVMRIIKWSDFSSSSQWNGKCRRITRSRNSDRDKGKIAFSFFPLFSVFHIDSYHRSLPKPSVTHPKNLSTIFRNGQAERLISGLR